MMHNVPYEKRGLKVQPDWIDYNGHMNMAYYAVLFDQCVDDVFEGFGLGPDYIKERGGSYYTLEAHIHYLREVHLDDPLRVTLQFLDYDGKRCHFYEEMFHETEDWQAAAGEFLVMHVDVTEKRSSPFPEDILAKVEAFHETHKALPRPERVGNIMGIRRK